ncbi:hypothetical protein V0288_09215 [Pannus brasiliensis CCIBt3594]|uniref:Uncharacterized protein n=1 Tax=Pannus brasiliensis CCIBt3594 TaxID=1427578 RepID=A0AAW9QHL1_9CHRO
MTLLLDDLGIWTNLGTLFPSGDWVTFPLPAERGLSIFRASWGGDLSDIKSFVYLRAIYTRGGFAEPDSRWKRLYPKSGSEIFFLTLPEELQSQGISRAFQCQKWFRRLRLGINKDSRYSLNLQEFQPLPEFEQNFKVLKASDLDAITVRIIEAIREEIP